MDKPVTNSLLSAILFIFFGSLLLHFGAFLFVPMLFGLLIAFIVYPFCLWLEHQHIPRSIAITICLSIIFILFSLLVYLLIWQLQMFKEEFPIIGEKLKIALLNTQNWLQKDFNVTLKMQDEWIHSFILNSGNRITTLIDGIFSATSSALFMFFITPVYAVLFLYHRSTFVSVVIKVLSKRNEKKIRSVLQQTIFTYANFIRGMVLVYFIVGVLNAIGLSELGIKHAILFGMLTAIMTIIPYVGIILSSLLPISIAFITKDSLWYPVGVIGIFSFVQYLEGSVIFPVAVGRQLNISTWATLVAVIAGGMIWGVSGMILFIPIVAILKLIAENIPEWEALYILLKRDG
ncbi:AI-2E family transporter [Pedobacter gandavensis]|uniref:AI-2E family transporter n=1 Tax=Pedobacter gandavensis TaxID=2679963 RepID=UPI00247B1D83|nr:AI-2E family transporter [Pedobacter gandavensis]WGQ10631.1 AI-2E family transporter [Pedobacter gandavensis]